jgi:tetratricopeptide (TPR) repeat protein
MADYATVLRIAPDSFKVYLFRARFFKRKAETARLMGEAVAVTAANPKNAEAYDTAGQIYIMAQQPTLAARAFDRMIELAPTADNYLIHARYRPVADRAGRAADLEAALNHDVNSVDAWFMRADMQYQAGAYADALSSVNVAISIKGETAVLLAMRGAALRRVGQPDKADKDFRAARAKATIAGEFNDLCWFEATSGAAPDTALAACDAALAKVPGHATYLDSRGFALLRLNRFADAVADYTAALSQQPDAPTSLYGRAVAFRRLGNLNASDADLRAAKQADSGVDRVFASFGVAL